MKMYISRIFRQKPCKTDNPIGSDAALKKEKKKSLHVRLKYLFMSREYILFHVRLFSLSIEDSRIQHQLLH